MRLLPSMVRKNNARAERRTRGNLHPNRVGVKRFAENSRHLNYFYPRCGRRCGKMYLFPGIGIFKRRKSAVLTYRSAHGADGRRERFNAYLAAKVGVSRRELANMWKGLE